MFKMSINSKTPWVASVPVVVSDREASKKWYTEKLGLALIADEDHWESSINIERVPSSIAACN